MVLRIEDTDETRSDEKLTQGILDGLAWLGLDWDEGPHYQSQRRDLHTDLCARLVESGRAYYCFCRGAEKGDSATMPDPSRHDCRTLDSASSRRRAASEPAVVRFRVPSGTTVSFVDMVYGDIQVDSGEIEDFALLRSDGSPTYHSSVVADDAAMGITHVIRGADHLSNTPKQVLIYEAMEQTVPRFAHLPLILGPDKTRLSKRHGATSVLEFREEGFLPSALRNYLVRLGWSGGSDQEFFTQEELMDAFRLEDVHKSNAVWDIDKLEWMNAKMMGSAPTANLEALVRAQLESLRLWRPDWESARRDVFQSRIKLLQSRARKTTDFVQQGRAFFTEDFEYQQEAVDQHLNGSADDSDRAGLVQALNDLRSAYQTLEPFDLETTEESLRRIGADHGLKMGRFIGAVRVALTGQRVAPGIFDVIVVLGRDTVLGRLQRVLSFLGA